MASYYIDLEYNDRFSGVADLQVFLGALRYVRHFTLKDVEAAWYVFGYKLNKKKTKADSAGTDNRDEKFDSEGKNSEKTDLESKFKSVWKKIKMAYEFLTDESNERLRNLTKSTLVKLFNHIKPKKLEGDFEFGLGDPYYTGKVLEIFTFLYATMGDKLKVVPHWDENMFRGTLKCEGGFFLPYVAFKAFRLWNDRDFRKWRKKLNGN